MLIVGIKQLDNGAQKRPYADHIYKWEIDARQCDKSEMLEFCQKYLRKAGREKAEYFSKYKEKMSFTEHMKIVCEGWYTLTQKNVAIWEYEVHNEYID